MNQNYSHSTTAATANLSGFGPDLNWPKRPHNTYLLCCIVAIALISQACRSPTPTSSSEHSRNPIHSLSETHTTVSDDSPPAYTYMAEEKIEPITPIAVMPATGSVKVDPKRLITLSGVVRDQMYALANRLVELAEENDKPIDIVISSPGGSVSHGLLLIEAMTAVKAKGVTVRCHVPTLAASMAFVIFTQCSERYALPYAQLLFHAPRISGTFVITPQASVRLAKGLLEIERTLFELIGPVMGINDQVSSSWFFENYINETLFTASELERDGPSQWFTVVAQIKGYPGEFPVPYEATSQPTKKPVVPDVRETGI
jgi:ATP-dependent protease ClpP protease subunit